MTISNEFICGSANTLGNKGAIWVKVEDESNKSFIAYPMFNNIAIVDMSNERLLCTIQGHIGKITSLTYISCHDKIELISGSEDGNIRIHKSNYSQSGSFMDWEEIHILNGLKGSITCMSSFYTTQLGSYITASDVHGNICIWVKMKNEIEYNLLEEIKLPSIQMANDLLLADISHIDEINNSVQNLIALFIGGVDSKIQIRVSSINDKHIPSHFSYMGLLLGHEEWVTCLSAIRIDNKNILLASGSQDSKIRIWGITITPKISINSNIKTSNDIILSDISISLSNNNNDDDSDNDGDNIVDEGAIQILPEEIVGEARLVFEIQNLVYSIFFNAILLGHEEWVTSVNWMKTPTTNNSNNISSNNSNNNFNNDSNNINNTTDNLALFSTSMDRNMIIWKVEDKVSGVWGPSTRIGDIGGMLGGSVGANLLGFTGGCISPDCKSVLGIGYGGSFHLWSCNSNDACIDAYNDNPRWFPISFISGHFGSVNDLNWSFDGSYIVSTSSDQTCRLFSLLHNRQIWREVSRPQIHGFDMNSLVLISNQTSNYIVSASDEKVLRVFQTPSCVIDGLKKLCNITIFQDKNNIHRAYIPELGLSNRASDLMNDQEIAEQDSRNVSSLDWITSPLEGQLSDHTVWPEIKKMFGHTDHVMCVAISNNGKYLASACKARNSDTASILIWETDTLLNIQKLLAHESTVVCLKFSPNDKYLVSSGKDRILCLFQLNSINDKSPYSMCTAVRSAHKRIIWDCSWLVDSNKIITASRDGTCKVWEVENNENNNLKSKEFLSKLSCLFTFSPFDGVSVTAIDIYHYNDNKLISLAAIGSESGEISIFELTSNGAIFKSTINKSITHSAAVKKIKWRPTQNFNNNIKWLASCGDDYSVRIFKLENE